MPKWAVGFRPNAFLSIYHFKVVTHVSIITYMYKLHVQIFKSSSRKSVYTLYIGI